MPKMSPRRCSSASSGACGAGIPPGPSSPGLLASPSTAAGPAYCSETGGPTVHYLQDTTPGKAADDTTELLGEIHAAVNELRPEYRTVFVLFHEHGLPYEDVARILKRPVGTIKTWLHRARLEVLDSLQRRGMVPKKACKRNNLLAGS